MYKRVKHIVLFSLLALTYTQVLAQDQKIGFFESDFILSKIPEYVGIEQRLQILSDGWKAEIEQMELEISNLEQDFQAKEILYTEELREEKRKEIDDKKNQKNSYIAQKFGPDGDYVRRQEELLRPIQRQVFAAVRKVAERQGMDFVFDRSGDIYMVYARDEWNLNEAILLELGIEIEN